MVALGVAVGLVVGYVLMGTAHAVSDAPGGAGSGPGCRWANCRSEPPTHPATAAAQVFEIGAADHYKHAT